MGASMRAILALEDGRIFQGEAFGAPGTSVGEICFNTSMTGYQEVLTDPSYRGQIVAMTYPLIGNYGTNELDAESRSPHVRGFVIEELSEAPSNWRAEISLEQYLRRWNIPGLQGVDTRSLTRHLRTRGAMKACLATEDISPEEAVRRALEGEGVVGMDYVREVTAPHAYQWDPDDALSAALGYRRQQNADAPANPAPHRGLRLWHKGKHPAPAKAEWLCRHRCARNHHREGSTRAFPRWRLSLQRSR